MKSRPVNSLSCSSNLSPQSAILGTVPSTITVKASGFSTLAQSTVDLFSVEALLFPHATSPITEVSVKPTAVSFLNVFFINL